ncbi:MAG: alpha-galactosidase [Clostridia bacterium]|nr:alpha-galactosidase [Clostridia bacterium]
MEFSGAYLQTADGEKHFDTVRIFNEIYKDVNIVRIEGTANLPLDGELGASFVFEPGNIENYMSDYRHTEYWCRPFFGNDLKDLHDNSQCLIYKKNGGGWGVILPLVSEDYKCILCGTERGGEAKLFSWCEKLKSCVAPAFAWAEGDNPYKLISRIAKRAAQYLGFGLKTIDEREYPNIFEYLGWCSWDAFEIRVSEEKLLKKCEEFKLKNIPVKWVIIDDMWGEVHEFYGSKYETRQEMFDLMHNSTLYDYAADPVRFPDGLKKTVKKIKEYGFSVGVWHPTTGYWAGITKDGPLAESQKNNLLTTECGYLIPSYMRDKAYNFYSSFHDFLKNSGIDFVKIDNQSMTRRYYKKFDSVGSVCRNFHSAIEQSVKEHFGNVMINCMGMASEDMWNRTDSPVSRCSDDFQPENREWFSKHILQCSYNSLIQGQFYHEDWDMWWTDDGQALKNSVIRAISGGPVYVSDKLKRSIREIIMPLILSDGKILRCDRPATPTRDCLTVDPRISERIFKLQNICGDSGVIATFNLRRDDGNENGFISPSDVEGIRGDEFAVYEHFSREFKIMKRDEKLKVSLKDTDKFKLFIVVPLDKCGNCVIGRTDKFISPKTVINLPNGKKGLVEMGPFAYVKDKKIYFEE